MYLPMPNTYYAPALIRPSSHLVPFSTSTSPSTGLAGSDLRHPAQLWPQHPRPTYKENPSTSASLPSRPKESWHPLAATLKQSTLSRRSDPYVLTRGSAPLEQVLSDIPPLLGHSNHYRRAAMAPALTVDIRTASQQGVRQSTPVVPYTDRLVPSQEVSSACITAGARILD